jgi:carboxypeptidase PM20D1
MIKRILVILLVAVVVLVAILLFNTFKLTSIQPQVDTAPAPEVRPESLAHLQGAIKFRTISFGDTTLLDTAQFNGFHRYLRKTYPLTHEKLALQIVAGHSLLYKWQGSDPSLRPFVLMAHQDVVPIEDSSRSLWTVDPFEGVVKENFIWGRGSCDDKINLIGIMEAVEKLLIESFQPKRTIYLAFGHDEEVGGIGARAIAAELQNQDVDAELVLDEGGIVTLNQVPGVTKPVALIGTAEKGYLSLELKVEINGGHSSMPAKETAMDVLNRALVALHDNPFPARFTTVTEGFLEHVGPEMSFTTRMAVANQWLLGGVVLSMYEKSPGANASVRTTMVPTVFHAGVKDNIVPTSVSAIVNLRLLPGDSSSLAIMRVKNTINDERVVISTIGGFASEPTGITSSDGPGFKVVQEIVRKTFRETITTPFLMIGGTDSRHLEGVSKNIIKFSPMTDPIGFHGIDERVSVDSYKDTLWFFETLLRTTE